MPRALQRSAKDCQLLPLPSAPTSSYPGRTPGQCHARRPSSSARGEQRALEPGPAPGSCSVALKTKNGVRFFLSFKKQKRSTPVSILLTGFVSLRAPKNRNRNRIPRFWFLFIFLIENSLTAEPARTALNRFERTPGMEGKGPAAGGKRWALPSE